MGPILLFHGWFGTRISSPIQLATLQYTLSESEVAQKRARGHSSFSAFFNTSKKIVSSVRQTAVTLRLNQEVARLGADQPLLRKFYLQMMNAFPHHCIRRCALSQLGRAHSVVNANGGYLED